MTTQPTRAPHIAYQKGDRRPGRGPRLLILTGGLLIALPYAAEEWMARRLADEETVLPLVFYARPWIWGHPWALVAVALAGAVAIIAGIGWLMAAGHRNKEGPPRP